MQKKFLISIFSIVLWTQCISEKNEREAFFHIGPPKTGTTSIQKALIANELLLSQNNFINFGKCDFSHICLYQYLFPSNEMERHINKFPAQCRMNDTEINDFLKDLHNSKKNFILSSEFFYFAPLERMQSFFHDYNRVHVVLYYRDFLSFILSQHNEIIRLSINWEKDSKLISLDTRLKNDFMNTVNKFFQIFRQAKSMFGEGNIHVVDFDGLIANRLNPEDVFFCDILKIPCENNKIPVFEFLNVSIDSNPSIDLKPYDMVRCLEDLGLSKKCYLEHEKMGQILSYNWNLEPIMKELNLEKEKNDSFYYDSLIRKEINLIHGNNTASENNIKNVKYFEVDCEKMFQIPDYLKLFEKALKKYIRKEIFKCK